MEQGANDDLRQELRRLAERLARLEAHLNLPAAPEPPWPQPRPQPPPQPVPPPAPDQLTADLVEKRRQKQERQQASIPPAPIAPALQPPPPQPAAPPTPPKAPPVAPPAPSAAGTRKDPDLPKASGPAWAAPAPSPPAAPPTAAPPPRMTPVSPPPAGPRAKPRRDPIEVIIGGKWAAWLGAAAVFAAALFAIKIAIDQGWWGRLTPLTRALIIAAGGAIITGAGEIVLRKVNRMASVGLFSAGLGVLYLDAFATFRYWDLLSKEWSFALMGVVAVGGFALTWRTKSLTIGILSIIAGYLTPVLLRGQTEHDLEMLSFLTMLLGISLGLAALAPKPFRPLRYVALGALCAVALGWLISNGPAHWILGIVFMSIWWTMILAESVFTAAREQAMKTNIIMTLLATAAYATAGCWILSAGPVAGTDWTGGFSAMIAVLAATVALYFGPGIDGLRAFPRRAIDKLAVALWIQAGILLGIAIALHFDEYGRASGWLIVGLGAIETGRRLPSKGLDIFGLIVLAIALFDVLFVSWWAYSALQTVLWQGEDLTINGWAVLVLTAMAFTIAAAHRLNDHWPNHWKMFPIVLASIATALWVIWWYFQATGLLITTGWLIGAALLLLVQRFARRPHYFELGQLLLLAAAARWGVVDVVQERFAGGWDPFAALPVINARTALAAAIGLGGWWVSLILRRRARAEAALGSAGTSWVADGYGIQFARQAAVLFIIGIAVIALSFDVDRIVERLAQADAAIDWLVGHVRQNVLTLLWSAAAFILGLLGRLMSAPPSGAQAGEHRPKLLIYTSTAIMVICAFKWLIFDTLLWFGVREGGGARALMPVVNVQMITGVVLAVTGILLRRQVFAALEAFEGVEARGGWRDPAAWVPAIAACIVLWGASFEVDRVISRVEQNADAPLAYAPIILRALWLTGLWAAGGLLMVIVGRLKRVEAWVLTGVGAVLIMGGAITWLTYDTIAWRMAHAPLDVPVALNLQCLIGLGIAGLLVASWMLHGPVEPARLRALYGRRGLTPIVGALVAAIILWAGSLELDRLFADDVRVRLASFSMWWGIYGVALVAIGFVKRLPAARYAGLALLAIVAVKVLFVDMARANNIWRVVSFLVFGLLAIVTSIAYSKLGRLLEGEEEIHHRDTEGTEGG